jgi:hypothetical protein
MSLCDGVHPLISVLKVDGKPTDDTQELESLTLETPCLEESNWKKLRSSLEPLQALETLPFYLLKKSCEVAVIAVVQDRLQ